MAQQSASSDLFGSLGQQWSQAFSGSAVARRSQAFQQVLQESATVQAIHETATRPCVVCQQRFLRTNLNTCAECRQLCCAACFGRVRLYNATGECSISAPAKDIHVCATCRPGVLERHRHLNVSARMKRVVSYLEGHLEAYTYSPESKLEQSLRLTGHVVEGVKEVAGFLPFGKAFQAVNASYYIVRYGPLVLFGNDIVLSLQLLVNLSKKIDVLNLMQKSPQDLFGGLYYMMGEHAAERAKTPALEHLEHVDNKGSVPQPSLQLLMDLRRLVRLLYVTTYADPTPTDIQRIMKQVIPGSELVLAELSDAPSIPSYFLTCVRSEQKAYLILPGTRNASDVATDVNAEAEKVAGGQAHRGMAESARWLKGEVGPALVHLYTRGYTVMIVGHSLGAAVGALLTAILRSQISTLKCYGFGTPACVDEDLMCSLLDCVVSVVNRDDVVPRLNVQNVHALAHSALCTGQVAKTKAWMDEDMKAVKDIERIVELRRRSSSSAAEGVVVRSLDSHAAERETKIERLCAAGVTRTIAERALEREDWDLNRALLRATDEEVSNPQGPPAEGPVAGSANSSHATENRWAWQGGGTNIFDGLANWASTAFAGHGDAGRGASDGPSVQQQGDPLNHPRFFIPGQVIHLYKKDGLSRAALASSTHETFARILPTTHMLEDHKLRSYDDALRQACISKPLVAQWESSEQRLTCACCDADFNWAYVLKSEPQKALARHNCFACGRLVCDGCSKHRLAQQHLGFTLPVRTCDTCFFDQGVLQ